MADTNPFANMGLGMMGADSSYAKQGMSGAADNGLGAVGALYLANKFGLIDLKNKDQMDSIKKNGLAGHFAMDYLNGAKKPPENANMPVNPNVTVGGAMPQSALQEGSVPALPFSSGNQAMDSQLSSFPNQKTQISGYDPESIDSGMANFAKLFA